MTVMNQTSGFDVDRLSHLENVISNDVAAKKYWGARIIVARHGEIGLDTTIGYADEAGERPVRHDSVFTLFSMSKGMTNTLALRAIELDSFRWPQRSPISSLNLALATMKPSQCCTC